ncbi:MAG TPA: hypothetical protein VMF61_02780 [Candidatus Acidoferrales bacterium]|nr:hypothetical protein [Candidatus Acidoferrales bacterium]
MKALVVELCIVVLVASGCSGSHTAAQSGAATVPISPSGEFFDLSNAQPGVAASLSLPPPNGPGATPNGTVRASVSTLPPSGVPALHNAIGYFSVTSSATTDVTGTMLATIRQSNLGCLAQPASVAFLSGSKWIVPAVPRPFTAYQASCDLSRGYSVHFIVNPNMVEFPAGRTLTFAVYETTPVATTNITNIVVYTNSEGQTVYVAGKRTVVTRLMLSRCRHTSRGWICPQAPHEQHHAVRRYEEHHRRPK